MSWSNHVIGNLDQSCGFRLDHIGCYLSIRTLIYLYIIYIYPLLCSCRPLRPVWYRPWTEGRGAPMMRSALLTMRCSLVLSCLVAAQNHTVMEHSTDLIGVFPLAWLNSAWYHSASALHLTVGEELRVFPTLMNTYATTPMLLIAHRWQ